MYLPQINTKGMFVFKEPVKSLLPSNIEYTVISHKLFSELESNNVDVFLDIYQRLNLTKDDYLRDKKNNIVIVTLLAKNGKQAHVPVTYICGVPKEEGVDYQERIIMLSTGLQKTDIDLEILKDEIAEIVYKRLGVKTIVKDIPSSPIVKIDRIRSEAYENVRKNKITVDGTYKDMYEKLKNDYDIKLEIINRYERFIMDRLKDNTNL